MSEPSDKLKMWRNRIEIAKKYQHELGNQKMPGTEKGRWDIFRMALAGDFNSLSDLGEDAVDVNVLYATAKTVLPPLWVQKPHFTFKPKVARGKYQRGSFDNIRRAEFAELEVNYWVRELKLRTTVAKPCIQDAETCNHGYALINYILDKSEIENKDGEIIEPNPTVRFKQPTVSRISPKRVLLPPGYNILEEAPWCAIWWTKPLQDARDRFDNQDIAGNRAIAETGNTTEMTDYLESDDAKLLDFYEIYDKRGKEVLTVGEGHDEFLKEQDWTIEYDGFPLVDLTFNEISDDYYGSPPMQYIYPQNKELNAIRTSMAKRFRRTKSVIFASGEVSPDFTSNYNDADDGGIVNTGLPAETPIRNMLMTDPGLPADQVSLIYEQRIKDDILQISGLSAEQRGTGDPNVDSATSSANVEKGVQIRATDRGDAVNGWFHDIARKLWMVLQQFPDVKRSRLIAGPETGKFTEIEYTLREIRGEFDIEINMASMLPETAEGRMAMSMGNYNMFRADPQFNPTELALDVLRSQDKVQPERYLLELRDPQDEFEMMMQGLPVEPHERDAHEAHSAAHEEQADELEKQLDSMDPESEIGRKLRITMSLLMAHQNAHAFEMQQIAQATGKGTQPGQPQDLNKARIDQANQGGSVETEAELGGQSLA